MLIIDSFIQLTSIHISLVASSDKILVIEYTIYLLSVKHRSLRSLRLSSGPIVVTSLRAKDVLLRFHLGNLSSCAMLSSFNETRNNGSDTTCRAPRDHKISRKSRLLLVLTDCLRSRVFQRRKPF
jgi:hypothetical protein